MQPPRSRLFLLVTSFLVVFICAPAAADDNDIFGVVEQEAEPNILIVFDNSQSMDEELELDKDRQECRSCGWADWIAGKCIASRMDAAKNTVKNIIEDHGADNRFGIMIFHSNRSNNGVSGGGGFIPEYEGRYAVCSVKDTFVLDEDYEKKKGSAYEQAVYDYTNYLKDLVDDIELNMYTPLAETLAEAGRYFAGQDSLFNRDEEYYPVSGRYPDDEIKAYNQNVGHPPIGYRCRKNYIILMTDGEPTRDNASILRKPYMGGHELPASGNYPGYTEGAQGYKYYKKGQPELQDIAGFIHDNDINTDLEGKQNIITYTIGFCQGVDDDTQKLLQDTADRGGGHGDTSGADDGGLFFYAAGEQDLFDAFETIIKNINEDDSMFAPVTIPVSEDNPAYAGKYGYVSMFKPQSGKNRWRGNLKKYRLNRDNEFVSCDESGDPVLDENGSIKDDAVSCWTAGADGGKVDSGGAGEILSETYDDLRNIYSNINVDEPRLYWPENRFHRNNDELSAENFGVSDRDELIDSIRMVQEEWKLGDLNHSSPEVVTCDSGKKYILVGSNDGMLHCFKDKGDNVIEKWAFVPSEQFGRLEEVYTGDHSYFMDGSPVAAVTENRKVLICGERRGGNHYYAIDISEIEEPEYLYTHTTMENSCAGSSCSGQSWKTPQFIKVAAGEQDTEEAFLLTGGYDPAYDKDDYFAGNPAGNSVYAIRAEDGNIIFGFDDSDLLEMKHSIVSAFAADTVDDGKDIISRIYAGDLGGNMFAFRDDNDPDDPGALDSDWHAMHLFSAVSSGRKIFEEADFVREDMEYWNAEQERWETVRGDWVYFGTGDRANPLRTDTENRFYCIKNDWHTKSLDVETTVGQRATLYNPDITDHDQKEEKVLLDVTENIIQDGTNEQKSELREAMGSRSNRGWYISLEKGEKCLSAPAVHAGVVYFTTFIPYSDAGGPEDYDPCTIGGKAGETRLYAIAYKTGAAVYTDFGQDPPEDSGDQSEPTKQDRYMVLENSLLPLAVSPLVAITEHGLSVINFPHSRKAKDGGRN